MKIISTSLTIFTVAIFLAIISSGLQHAQAATTTTYINGKIAYVSTERFPDTNIYNVLKLRNGDGSNPVNVYKSRFTSLSSPSFSPNGQQLLLVDDYDIYKMNPDGTNRVNLTNNVSRDEGPKWSPDGTKIAYISDRNRATANYRLWIMNADGTNPQDISDASSTLDRFASWSPDSKKIYFDSARGAGEQVYSYDLQTQTSSAVTTLPGSAIEPSVSPDGTKVMFAHAGTGDSKIQLYVQNIDGTNFHKLFQQCSNNYSQWGKWSPDGKKLIFVSPCVTSPQDHVHMVNADGTGEKDISATLEDVFGEMDWQRIPVTTSTVDQVTGKTENQQSDDHADTDYEVYNNEDLLVDGKTKSVIVHAQGTLKGHGTTADTTIEDQGHLAPGNSPGCLSTGNLTLSSGSTLDEDLGGTTACSGYDQVKVTGTVTIPSATLNPILYGGFVPTVGNTFTIINNDGVDPVVGTFNGLIEAATLTVNGVTYKISYLGGDGNDVTLTVVAVPNLAAAQAAASQTPAATAPKAPNTGMTLISANPLAALTISTAAAGALLTLSRRFNRPLR